MRVSVITVCFNSAATITKTLHSVASQTWADIEHIVIDGASTDATLAILHQHRAQLGRLVSEPDKGVYEAMNKGVALATGDVIAFLNADDVYKDDSVIARVVQCMQEDHLDVLFGNVAFFHPGRPLQVVRTYDSGRFTPARLGWGWMPAHPALFVRREVFEHYGKFSENYKIAGDFEFVARIFKPRKLKYKHLAEVLVRMQTGGLSTAGLKATYLLNLEILRACRQNGIRTNWLMVLSKYFFKVRELF
jgi:glycosyltransferase involved in cell wall biosynthesis